MPSLQVLSISSLGHYNEITCFSSTARIPFLSTTCALIILYYLHLIAKMVLLYVTVADINSRKALLPWEIVESHPETDTIREFFNSVCLSHQLLDNYSYTCGFSLQDIELPQPFREVYIRNINCYEPIEMLYYSAGYDPICI